MGEAKRKSAAGYVLKETAYPSSAGWVHSDPIQTLAHCKTFEAAGKDAALCLGLFDTIDRAARATTEAIRGSIEPELGLCIVHAKIMAHLLQKEGIEAGATFGYAHFQVGDSADDCVTHAQGAIGTGGNPSNLFHAWNVISLGDEGALHIDTTTQALRRAAADIDRHAIENGLPRCRFEWEDAPPYLLWYAPANFPYTRIWESGPDLKPGAWLYCPIADREHKARKLLEKKADSWMFQTIGLANALMAGMEILTPRHPNGFRLGAAA